MTVIALVSSVPQFSSYQLSPDLLFYLPGGYIFFNHPFLASVPVESLLITLPIPCLMQFQLCLSFPDPIPTHPGSIPIFFPPQVEDPSSPLLWEECWEECLVRQGTGWHSGRSRLKAAAVVTATEWLHVPLHHWASDDGWYRKVKLQCRFLCSSKGEGVFQKSLTKFISLSLLWLYLDTNFDEEKRLLQGSPWKWKGLASFSGSPK